MRLGSVKGIVLPAARLGDAIAAPLGLAEQQILWNLLGQLERQNHMSVLVFIVVVACRVDDFGLNLRHIKAVRSQEAN